LADTLNAVVTLNALENGSGAIRASANSTKQREKSLKSLPLP
jgi:hypothetical protein